MKNFFQKFSRRNIITLVLFFGLLVIIAVTTTNTPNVRDNRSSASTTNTRSALSGGGSLRWLNTTYPADPGGSCTVSSGFHYLGTNWDNQFSKYGSNRSYISFDFDALPNDAIIQSASLVVYTENIWKDADFKIRIRDYNWTERGLTCSDYGGNPPSATYANGGFSTKNVPKAFGDITIPITNLGTIKKSGLTTFMLTTDIEEQNSNSNKITIMYYFSKPRLKVTWTVPLVTTSISADDTSISYNTATTVRWSSTNASTCALSGLSTSNPYNGSASTGRLTTSKTYSITCSNNYGSSTKSVTVKVGAKPSSGGGSSGGSSGGSGSQISPPVATLPPPSGTSDPNILKTLKLKIAVAYLQGKIKVPIMINGLKKELIVEPDKYEYDIDVSGAKIKLGRTITISAGGKNTLLMTSVSLRTKAQKHNVDMGTLYLGDVSGDNKINIKDSESFLNSLSQKKNPDVNKDGVANAMDWAIILAGTGRVGSN